MRHPLFCRKTVPDYMYVNEYLVHGSLTNESEKKESPFF